MTSMVAPPTDIARGTAEAAGYSAAVETRTAAATHRGTGQARGTDTATPGAPPFWRAPRLGSAAPAARDPGGTST